MDSQPSPPPPLTSQDSTNSLSSNTHTSSSANMLKESPTRGFIDTLREKRDVITLGTNFFLLFTMFATTQNYVTSVNKRIGFWSLAVLYIVLSLSSLVAPAIVKRYPAKWLFLIAAVTYVMFVVAQVWANLVSLIIAAVLNGVGGALLWIAQGTYVSQVTVNKAELGENSGLFWALFVTSMLIGNLFAAVFLLFSDNYRMLFLILSGVGVLACFTFLLLRSPPARSSKPIKMNSLVETARLATSRPMLLVTPLIVASGVEAAFSWGSFASRVPTRLLGFCFVAAGACNMTGGVVLGRLSDRFGRQCTLIIGQLCIGAAVVGSSFASDKRPYLYFVVLAFIGLAEAAISVVITSVLPLVKPLKVESAFGYKMAVASAASSVLLFVAPLLSFETIQVTLWIAMTVGVICVLVCDRFVISINAKPSAMLPSATSSHQELITPQPSSSQVAQLNLEAGATPVSQA